MMYMAVTDVSQCDCSIPVFHIEGNGRMEGFKSGFFRTLSWLGGGYREIVSRIATLKSTCLLH